MMSEPSPVTSHELWRCWTLLLWACAPCLAELASLLIWHWIQSTRGSSSKVRARHQSPQSLLTATLARTLLPARSYLRVTLCCSLVQVYRWEGEYFGTSLMHLHREPGWRCPWSLRSSPVKSCTLRRLWGWSSPDVSLQLDHTAWRLQLLAQALLQEGRVLPQLCWQPHGSSCILKYLESQMFLWSSISNLDMCG